MRNGVWIRVLERFVQVRGLHQASVGGVAGGVGWFYGAVWLRNEFQGPDFLGRFREVQHVLGAVLPEGGVLYRGDMGDGRDGGALVDSDVLDAWHHAGMDADLIPAILADEGFLESVFPGGNNYSVKLRGVNLTSASGRVGIC